MNDTVSQETDSMELSGPVDTNETKLIPLAQRFIAGQSERTVSARKLHEFLGVARDFTNWITARIDQYEFRENQDFILVRQNGRINKGRGGDRRSKDYYLTLDMAKELAMVERTAKGRESRRYFIACERELRERHAQEPPKALPSPATPPDPITPDVRAAINRRAHALSLRHYDRLRSDLLEAVRRHLERFPGETDLVAFVERVDTPDCALVPVHRSDLWWLTTRVAMMETVHRDAMKAVHALEASTGSKWYTRPLWE